MICSLKVTVQRRNFYGELHFDMRVNSRKNRKWNGHPSYAKLTSNVLFRLYQRSLNNNVRHDTAACVLLWRLQGHSSEHIFRLSSANYRASYMKPHSICLTNQFNLLRDRVRLSLQQSSCLVPFFFLLFKRQVRTCRDYSLHSLRICCAKTDFVSIFEQ